MASYNHVPCERIVICCDGTWCGPSTGTKTNTKILADSFASARQQDEVNLYKQNRYDDCYAYYNDTTNTHVLYMPGIGTSTSRGFEGYMVDAVLAIEIKKCCTTAYKFIAQHFGTAADTEGKVQTRVYLFGHSRGAFTVRSVAGMVRNCGILNLGDPDVCANLDGLLEEVYNIYTSKDDRYSPYHDSTKDFRLLRSHHDTDDGRLVQPPIEFMGLLDTVGALGVPKLNSGPGVAYEFYDTVVSSDVLHVWQALAVHDRLTVFTPCHITRKQNEAAGQQHGTAGRGSAATSSEGKGHTWKEVWMPGSHYDIGRQRFVFLRNVAGWEGVLSKINRYLDPLCINITPNKELADLALLEVLKALYDTSADAQEMLEDPHAPGRKPKLAERYRNRLDRDDTPKLLLWADTLLDKCGTWGKGLLRKLGLRGKDVSQDAYDNIAGRLGMNGGLLLMPHFPLFVGPVGRVVTMIVKNLVTTCLPIVLEDRHIPLYEPAEFVSTKHLDGVDYLQGLEGPFHSKAFSTYRISSGRALSNNGDKLQQKGVVANLGYDAVSSETGSDQAVKRDADKMWKKG